MFALYVYDGAVHMALQTAARPCPVTWCHFVCQSRNLTGMWCIRYGKRPHIRTEE